MMANKPAKREKQFSVLNSGLNFERRNSGGTTEFGNKSEKKFTEIKINNEVVRPVIIHKNDKLPRHHELFVDTYCNVGIVASKEHGKTSVIAKIISKAIGPNTKVYVFCSTINKDDTWLEIRKYVESHGNTFIGHTEIKNDDHNYLAEFLEEAKEKNDEQLDCEEEKEDEEKEDEEKEEFEKAELARKAMFGPSQEEKKQILEEKKAKTEEKKARESKYITPEKIIIFDDLSDELRNPKMEKLLKVNRHLKAMVIVSSHIISDVKPGTLQQFNYLLLYRSVDDDRLRRIHKVVGITVDYNIFKEYFHQATSENRWDFLYIRCLGKEEFRKNFDIKLIDL